MSLALWQGMRPDEGFREDARCYSKISEKRIDHFLEISLALMTKSAPISLSSLGERLNKEVSLRADVAIRAYRFFVWVAREFPTVTPEEVESDFQALKIPTKVAHKTIDFLNKRRTELAPYWKKERHESVPVLSEINWRVDVRTGSSDYLAGKEIVALLRIQANDGEELSQIYMEIDRERLSLLEQNINALKRRFLEAEKSASQT
jgi:hypothetical protein